MAKSQNVGSGATSTTHARIGDPAGCALYHGWKGGKHSKRVKNEWFRDAYELDMKSWIWTKISTDSVTGISMIMKHPICKCFPLAWDGDPNGIIAFGASDKDAGASKLSSRKELLDHFYLNLSSGVYLTPMASGDVPTKRHSYSIVHYSNHLNYVASNVFDLSSDNQATANNSCFILFGGHEWKRKIRRDICFLSIPFGLWEMEKTQNDEQPDSTVWPHCQYHKWCDGCGRWLQ